MNRKSRQKLLGESFVTKLFGILEDPLYHEILRWTDSKDAFEVISISELTQAILPVFFKHQNYSSFIRQLNLYGFHKVRKEEKEEGRHTFMNPNFKRDERQAIQNIKRKSGFVEDKDAENQEIDPRSKKIYVKQETKNNKMSIQVLSQDCMYLVQQNEKINMKNVTLQKGIKKQKKKTEIAYQNLLELMKSKEREIVEREHRQREKKEASSDSAKDQSVGKSDRKQKKGEKKSTMAGNNDQLQDMEEMGYQEDYQPKKNKECLNSENYENFLSINDFLNINSDQDCQNDSNDLKI